MNWRSNRSEASRNKDLSVCTSGSGFREASWPVVGLRRGDGIGRDALHLLVELCIESGDEVLDQHGNVGEALT